MVTTFITPDSQEARCPACGALIKVSGRRRRVQCPKCRETVTLSAPAPEDRLPKPPPPAANAPAGIESARLEALESRIAVMESAKPKAQGPRLEGLESRIAAIEESLKAAPRNPAGANLPENPPADSGRAPIEMPREDRGRPEPAGIQPGVGSSMKRSAAAGADIETHAAVARLAPVPPSRLRWLAAGEAFSPDISPAQEEALLHNLRTIAGQAITIRTITGNPFLRKCAESFKAIFERAGWAVRGVEEIPRTTVEAGLSLAVASLPVEKEAAATYLALKAAGFSPVPILDTALASGAKDEAAPLSLTLAPAKAA